MGLKVSGSTFKGSAGKSNAWNLERVDRDEGCHKCMSDVQGCFRSWIIQHDITAGNRESK